MMLMVLVGFGSAVMLIWGFTSKYREHRPTAALLSVLLGIDVAQHALELAVLAPLRARLGLHDPWTGWAWAASLLNNAIELVWPAALVAASLVVFARRKPWAAFIAWAAAVAAYALLHPLASDGSQLRFHGLAQVLGGITSTAMGITWYRRREEPGDATAQHALTAIVLMELLALPGTLQVGPFPNWPTPQALYALLFVALFVMQAYAVLRRLGACEQRLDTIDKGNMRANLRADKAVETAERAEGRATEARDLADLALPKSRQAHPL